MPTASPLKIVAIGTRIASRFERAGVALAVVAAACAESDLSPEIAGDPDAGAAVIARVACGVCHAIPGVPGADGIVAPSLERFALRTTIAGVVPNQPSVLVEWIQNAPSLAPDTMMPAMPIDDREARDIAAYLYTLK